jgi:hypothetical protein
MLIISRKGRIEKPLHATARIGASVLRLAKVDVNDKNIDLRI